MKFHVGKESQYLGDRKPVIPTSQCLGGGSTLNFCMYTRPAASDFNDWEDIHGNSGWGFHDLLPLFRKMETYQIGPASEIHGDNGPIKISYGGMHTALGQEFMDAALGHDKCRHQVEDANDFMTCNGYQRWPKFIDAHTGRRSDVAHNYLFNHDHQNLTIVTEHLVKRVIFEDQRAVGVEYVRNPQFGPSDSTDIQIARARKMVVVSAGTFGSPAILERSGIGRSDLLQDLNIEVVIDLPGVGENYQDHHNVINPYCVDVGADTLDCLNRNDPEEIQKWSTQWARDGSGLLATNAIDAGVKMRPFEGELEKLGPDFHHLWKEYFVNAPDKPVLYIGHISGHPISSIVDHPRKFFGVGYFSLYPASVGHVHISSAEDISAPLDLDPKFLTKPEDVAVLRWGYKHSREIARRMPSYRGEFLPAHPEFLEGSRAACHSESRPVDISEPGLEYTEEDDRAIDEHIRKFAGTSWHSMGTCAMKLRENGGVVNNRLNVYGLSRLKVADLSIAPANVSANTCATTIVIGEKAAILIAEELDLCI